MQCIPPEGDVFLDWLFHTTHNQILLCPTLYRNGVKYSILLTYVFIGMNESFRYAGSSGAWPRKNKSMSTKHTAMCNEAYAFASWFIGDVENEYQLGTG